ncbi:MULTISPECIES: YkvA family protein [Actinomadura]|uniref:YkvA family protein n=1 Tax=Actinomadura yumaensis TaxID=111807 RepID=A0ABW2CZK3_9ACTN|nr:DUF1232 domain-containing protein [Actinomadura sp. J1-007]MWK39459.1 DUF1232 domain-containing protein [Actinomadura sp. J1-007]
MVWPGLLLIVAGGAVMAVADGDLGGVDLTVAGAVAAVAGAALVLAGIVRLRRGRRRSGRAEAYGVQGYYRTGRGKIAAMAVAVLYIVSPIDLIPDVFLPVGIVDDATAFAWLAFALAQEHTRRSRTRRGTG